MAAFAFFSRDGVLMEEPVRNVKMKIMDLMTNSDAIHRGAGQIIPCARRAFYAAELSASPTIMEPSIAVGTLCESNN